MINDYTLINSSTSKFEHEQHLPTQTFPRKVTTQPPAQLASLGGSKPIRIHIIFHRFEFYRFYYHYTGHHNLQTKGRLTLFLHLVFVYKKRNRKIFYTLWYSWAHAKAIRFVRKSRIVHNSTLKITAFFSHFCLERFSRERSEIIKFSLFKRDKKCPELFSQMKNKN